MAVTIIDKPNSTDLYSVSYPIGVTLSSDIVGDPGIAQHRFYLEFIIDGTLVGTKYFVVISGNQATADMAKVVRDYVILSNLVDHPVQGQIILPRLCSYPLALELDPDLRVNVTINTGEVYYSSGVFNNITGGSFSWIATRGYTEDDDYLFQFTNWYDYYVQGTPNILPAVRLYKPLWPYSGYGLHSYPVNVQRLMGLGTGKRYIIIQVHVKHGATDTTMSPDMVIDTNINKWVAYIPLYWNTYTNKPTFQWITMYVYESDTTTPAGSPIEYIWLNKGVDACEDLITLMYKDRFFQWSFMDFPMKNYYSIVKEREIFEGQETGRYSYNRKGIESIRVNSDLCPELWNYWFEDLFMSNEIYAIGNSFNGNFDLLDRHTLRETQWQRQTSRNNGIIQYNFNMERSLNLFIP